LAAKYGSSFLAPTRKMYFFDRWLWKLPRRGNRGKRTTCFPLFPLRLGNSANGAEFPTVPTATAAGYQHWKKKNHQPPGPNQNEVDKLLMKA